MSKTQLLGIPEIAESQANKHVTHNEALRILEVFAGGRVLSRSVSDAQTLSPSNSDAWIVARGTLVIAGVDTSNDVLRVSGDETARFSVGDTLEVSGSTGNDGTYTVSALNYDSGNNETEITVQEDVTDATADGDILHAGGAFNDHEDDVAIWVGGAYLFVVPFEGAGPLWVNDEDVEVRWFGSVWGITGPELTVEDDGTVVLNDVANINFGTNLSVTDDGDGSVTVEASGGGGGSTQNRRNCALNPHLDIWQAGTSFNFTAGGDASGYTADGWVADCDISSGTTGECTVSRQSFTLGQTDVPGEPEFFLRHAQTTAAENGANQEHRLEGVIEYANQTVALSFYARVSSGTLTVTPRAQQVFGSGGSARVDVTANEGDISVTTSWQRFTRTFDLPSISGKTIGTAATGAGPSTDFSLLQPSGQTYTLDIAQCKIEIGSSATEILREEPVTDLHRCKRYFERFSSDNEDAVPFATGFCVSTSKGRCPIFFMEKYLSPVISVNAPGNFEVDGAGVAEPVSTVAAPSISRTSARIEWEAASAPFTAGDGCIVRSTDTTDAHLDVSARI